MIVLIAPPDDLHAQRVADALAKRGMRRVQIDASATGTQLARLDNDGMDLHVGGINTAIVEAVWFRRMGKPRAPGWSADEAMAFMSNMAQFCQGARWVNPIWPALANDGGNGKLHQLAVASRHGLAIPRTLATNSPDAALDFVDACKGGAVYKPFRSPVTSRAGVETVIYTTRVLPGTDMDSVRLAPCIFQEEVQRAYEVRATVVGSHVFACAMRGAQKLDVRLCFADVTYEAITLPRVVEAALLKTVHELGLYFAACDLIVTPEGKHVFLEANQAPQWLWVEDATGLPITEALCDLLGLASWPPA